MRFIEAILKLNNVLRVNEGLRKMFPAADSPADDCEKTHSGFADFEAVTSGSVVSHLLEEMFWIESFNVLHDLEHLDHVSSAPAVTQ